MPRPSDEILMAYADDMLAPAERARIAAYLATDADARATVEMFRTTSELAREAFVIPADAPPMDALAANILKHSLAHAKPVAGSDAIVVEVPPSFWLRATRIVGEAPRLAAALILLVGLAAGWFGARLSGGPDAPQVALGEVGAGTVIARVLERNASGQASHQVVVISTFRDRQGRPCREFEMLRQGTEAEAELAGVACRQPTGRWIVEGAARIAIRPSDQTGYVPSGADEKDALAALLTLIGAGKALTTEQEQALLRAGWK